MTVLACNQLRQPLRSKRQAWQHVERQDSARRVFALAAGPQVKEQPVAQTTVLEERKEIEVVDASDAAGSEDSGWLSAATRGMLLLNLGSCLFGSNQVVIKTAEELLSPAGLNALRFASAAICFLPLLLSRASALKQPGMMPAALELGAWLTLGYSAQAYGLSMTSASHGAFTLAFTAVTVPLLVGFSGKKVGLGTYMAAMIAVTGVGLLTTAGGDPNLGDFICVASAVLFGVHKWRGEAIVSKVDDSQALVALQLCILAICSIGLAAPEAVDLVASKGLAGTLADAQSLPWAEILFMGVGTTALTLWIEMEALKDVSAQMAALIYTTEPLWGASLAWVLLGDRWGTQGWVGASLIIGASAFSQLSGDNKERSEDTLTSSHSTTSAQGRGIAGGQLDIAALQSMSSSLDSVDHHKKD